MYEQLENLIRLQGLDREVQRLTQQLAGIAPQIEETRLHLAAAERALEEGKARVEGARKERRAAEKDLEVQIEKRRKFQEQQSKVKTNKEYQALMGELASLKLEETAAEDRILAQMEQQAEAEKLLPGLTAEVGREKLEFQQKERVLRGAEEKLRAGAGRRRGGPGRDRRDPRAGDDPDLPAHPEAAGERRGRGARRVLPGVQHESDGAEFHGGHAQRQDPPLPALPADPLLPQARGAPRGAGRARSPRRDPRPARRPRGACRFAGRRRGALALPRPGARAAARDRPRGRGAAAARGRPSGGGAGARGGAASAAGAGAWPEEVTVHIDGGSRGNPGEAGVGVYFQDRSGAPLQSIARYIGRATNNTAEYQALLVALARAREAGVKHLRVFSDSELLVNQVNGRYRTTVPHLQQYPAGGDPADARDRPRGRGAGSVSRRGGRLAR